MSTPSVITPAQRQEVLVYLEAEIGASLTSSLSAMLGGGEVAREKLANYKPAGKELCYRQTFDPPGIGAIQFRLDNKGALALGQKLLSAAGLEGESDEVALETLGEVLAQVSGRLGSSFSLRVKKEVTAKPMKTGVSASADTGDFTFKVTLADGTVAFFTSSPETELLASLAIEPAIAEPAALALQPTVAPLPVNTKNLDLLLDVELPVSVSFGHAQLQLKDVIKLTTGSIVELNRSVSEPVDIIVNNCVIARGEVVVVEGNFGVRIKQILSKQDRLRSLA